MSHTLAYPDVDVLWESEDGEQRLVLAYEEGSTDVPYDDGSTPIIVELSNGRVEQMEGRTSYVLPSEILSAYERFMRHVNNEEAFERYLRIFHGTTSVEWMYEGNLYVTFDTADWRKAMGITDGDVQHLDILGTGLANMDEVISWINGEVYYARLEQQVTWVRADDGTDIEDTMYTWEIVDSIGGFYGYEWAVEGAKEHLLPVASEACL